MMILIKTCKRGGACCCNNNGGDNAQNNADYPDNDIGNNIVLFVFIRVGTAKPHNPADDIYYRNCRKNEKTDIFAH